LIELTLYQYGCGTLVFWPSAVLVSYPAFIVSNFIVGFGLSCLEIAANPYIALCGPLEYAEVRLNLSQAFQAIGTVCSPLLATKVLFKSVNNATSLTNVQWAYLGISLFVFGLAIGFYYIPLPEASDEQLEELADERRDVYNARIGPWKVVYVTLLTGVFSQWCYVGLQEAVGSNLDILITALRPKTSLTPFDFITVAHTVFAAGRFLAALLNYLFTPRWILLGSYSGLIVCLALSMRLGSEAGTAIAVLTYLFEAAIFSIIFAMSMRGLGRHTKSGAALMTGAISGGAVFGPIQWAVANGHGQKYSYCVPLAVACFGLLFPVYLNIMPQARAQVDPIHGNRARRRAESNARQASTASGVVREEKAKQFGLPGIIARRQQTKHIGEKAKNRSSPSVQHVERRSMASADGSLSPVMTMDFGGGEGVDPIKQPTQIRPSRGHVANLALWPVDEGASDDSEDIGSSSTGQGSSGGSSAAMRQGVGSLEKAHNAGGREEENMAVTKHRPAWDQKGDEDDLDDYHAIMRKI
jgi:fucose permease